MTPTLKKMNYPGQGPILLWHAPADLAPHWVGEDGATPVLVTELEELKAPIQFAVLFVQRGEEINTIVPVVAPLLDPGDCIWWFAYPKGRSKRYPSDINRDQGWAILGQYGFEPVRQVAIDADWSALRFRRLAFIKSLTRDPSWRLTRPD